MKSDGREKVEGKETKVETERGLHTGLALVQFTEACLISPGLKRPVHTLLFNIPD